MNGELKELKDSIDETNKILWKHHDASAQQFRDDIRDELRTVSNKVSLLYEKYADRPCEVHAEIQKGLGGQVRALWAFMVVLFTAIAGSFFKK